MFGRIGWGALAAALAAAVAAAGCRGGDKAAGRGAEEATATREIAAASEDDARAGLALAKTFECARCHEHEAFEPPKLDKACVGCHAQITSGKFPPNEPMTQAKWAPVVAPLDVAPSLRGSRRLRRDYLEAFLRSPHDARPGLVAEMPRLRLSETEVRQLAAFLAPQAQPAEPRAPGDPGRGRAIVDEKGCGACHRMGGLNPPLAVSAPPALDGPTLRRATMLAPDLRHARERMTPSRLRAWLRDPQAEKSDSVMPAFPMGDAELNDVVAFLLYAPLEPPAKAEPPARLPALARPVPYAEVDAKVFRKICWHCHAEPDYALGDGGPGNSGGFGFAPRRLNLASYEGIAGGYVDEAGARHSVFEKDAEGVPRLVRALLARHDEEAGRVGEVRGMPLGLPPLSPEDIQLVESWVAQGRPR
ncbi:MAG TPA: cytochrome c [Polyangiaceae bacterium]|nr:cytochrome c [Polyangiaceae bacterium]